MLLLTYIHIYDIYVCNAFTFPQIAEIRKNTFRNKCSLIYSLLSLIQQTGM